MPHAELHHSNRIGWLRAAVLGANDGLISTGSLIVGVASAEAARHNIVLAGVAGLVAGALSMAAGEYVSVGSQADTEEADLARERQELATEPEREKAELKGIWVGRGLDPELAARVADQLTAHNALEAHARDELGMSEIHRARPLQAALASAGAFTVGALPPVLLAVSGPLATLPLLVGGSSLLLLAVLGATAAHLGGAPLLKGAIRVAFWGAVAMLTTGLVGRLFGTNV